MATQRALNRLQALLELDQRATTQAQNLSRTFSTVIQEIQAIANDLDIHWQDEVLAETTTGDEAEFRLLHTPVKPDSLKVYVNGQSITVEANVHWDTGVIIPDQPVPAGKRITADYIQLGLRSQAVEILEAIPSISLADINAKIQSYQTAIAWLNQNFPA